MRKRLALVVAGLTTLMLGVGAATASATTYNLTSDHCSGGCGPAGTIFGTVTLTQNGTTVDVTVHLNSPYWFAKTGSVDSQAFVFNGTGVALGEISVNQTVPGETLVAGNAGYTASGIGSFTFGISCSTCGGGLSDKFNNDIVFHVANASIADLTGGAQPFGADLGNGLTGNTGPIDASLCVENCTRDLTTPEPTSLVLLGSGLLLAVRGLRKIAS